MIWRKSKTMATSKYFIPHSLRTTQQKTEIQNYYNSLKTSLVAHWQYSPTDAVWKDSSVNQYNLTEDGLITLTTGRTSNLCYSNTVADTGGTSLFLDSNQPALYGGAKDFSIAAWVYPFYGFPGIGSILTNSLEGLWHTEYGLFALRKSSSEVNDVQFQFSIGVDFSEFKVVDPLFYPCAAWYLVIASHDSQNKTTSISVNGATPTTATYTGIPSNSKSDTSNVRIGRYSTNITTYGFFTGIIDDVAFWNRILVADDISKLYNNSYGIDLRGVIDRNNA